MPRRNDTPKDWERLEGIDTEKSWPVFQRYRDMPPPRSITGLAKELGVIESTVYGWSSEQDWAGRVLAYDNHLTRIKTRATENETQRMARRHTKGARLMQELGGIELQKTLKKARALDALEQVPTRTAAKLVVEGAKLERLVAGEVTERVGEVLDFSKLTDDELEQYRALAQKLTGRP